MNVNDLLEGHVALDLQCLDRVYLNGYVPNLQVGGQVVTFLCEHLGNPLPSPALFNKMGTRFRQAVAGFAEANKVPIVRFNKDERKADVMRPYLEYASAPGVVAIGVAQEFQSVFTGYERPHDRPGPPNFGFVKADRRVTVYYFYIRDDDFGSCFIKICSYFPYPAKLWANGHEWAKRQATKAGLSFTELANGFASCEAPGKLQGICDRLGPAHFQLLFERWAKVVPPAIVGRGPGGWLLVGTVHAPGGGLPHHRL